MVVWCVLTVRGVHTRLVVGVGDVDSYSKLSPVAQTVRLAQMRLAVTLHAAVWNCVEAHLQQHVNTVRTLTGANATHTFVHTHIELQLTCICTGIPVQRKYAHPNAQRDTPTAHPAPRTTHATYPDLLSWIGSRYTSVHKSTKFPNNRYHTNAQPTKKMDANLIFSTTFTQSNIPDGAR